MKKSQKSRRLLTICACLVLPFAPQFVVADDLQDQFDDAIEALEANRLRTARDKLSALLAENPNLNRARLELARTNYLLFDYDEAEKQAQQVLDNPDTPPSVRTTVLAFLAQIREDKKQFANRHNWTPSIYLGGLHDTNVNVGPSSDIVDIGGVLFNVTPASQEQDDTAWVVNGGIVHTFNPGRRIESGERGGFFVWQTQLDGYYRDYFSEHDFDLGVLTFRTGPAWFVPQEWRASIGLQADQIWLGGDELALFATLHPAFTWFVGANTDITIEGTLTNRDYDRAIDSGRDGTYTSGRLTVGHYLDGRKIGLQAGIGYTDFSADDDRFSHDGPEAFAGIVAQAWNNGSVYARVHYRQYDFEGPEPAPFLVPRDDDEYRYTVGFQHDFKSGILNEWSLLGDWTYTDNQDDDVPIYDYNRSQISLGIARSF